MRLRRVGSEFPSRRPPDCRTCRSLLPWPGAQQFGLSFDPPDGSPGTDRGARGGWAVCAAGFTSRLHASRSGDHDPANWLWIKPLHT
jgi:hypothetical protein